MHHPLIRKLEHYVNLNDEDRHQLQQLGRERVRRVGPREDIVLEGDVPAGVIVLNEGWSYRYKVLEDGRRQILAFLVPGDLCYLSSLAARPMDHTIAAATPGAIAEVPPKLFGDVIRRHPRIKRALLCDALVTSAIQHEWNTSLGRRNAIERMAHFLCELFIRLQVVGRTEHNSFEFPLTQAELGELTGLSTVHVNRTLQELRTSGLIVLKDKTLTIPRLPALMEAGLFSAAYLHLDPAKARFLGGSG